MTIELIAITTEWDCQAEKTEKKAKAEQLTLFSKSESLDTKSFSRGNKKRLNKSKKKLKLTDQYYACYQKGY